jgi:hypothetical protein
MGASPDTALKIKALLWRNSSIFVLMRSVIRAMIVV